LPLSATSGGTFEYRTTAAWDRGDWWLGVAVVALAILPHAGF
jgi:hypothetical protein